MALTRRRTVVTGFSLVILVVAIAISPSPSAQAQRSAGPARQVGQPDNIDWRGPNFDVHLTHYSPADNINVSNVGQLTLKWSIDTQPGQPVRSQVTPIVVDGVMYYNAGSKLFAVNAATGQPVWTYETGGPLHRRGPSYGDGRIYTYGQAMMHAVDAKTGKAVESFGNKGRLPVIEAAVAFKYKGQDFPGYVLSNPPNFYNGTLYLTVANSERHIRGGLAIALDAATGAIKWVFNTIPQGPEDDGWAIAKDTWVAGATGGVRNGGGMWYPPAIDPELGMLYINTSNPDPAFEGTARKGMNLFTNSIVALHLDTGKMAWYFQAVHHDIWEMDQVTGPLLYDVPVNGRTVKGLASAGKNCFLYLFNRETGQPMNPMVETVVPTKTDVKGEEIWPTQPFPYTAKGVPQLPFCQTYPMGMTDPDLNSRRRQLYTPYSATEMYVVSHGGSSFGSLSFSPRTGLLYVTGKNGVTSQSVKITGAVLEPAVGGHISTTNKRDYDFVNSKSGTGFTPTQTVTAYNPVTGDLVWQDEHPAVGIQGSPGNLSTGGDLVFQGSDKNNFYALDAHTGKKLFTYTAKGPVVANPLTYRVDGRQYVTVMSGGTLLTFGLP
jgi:glucose dehydrogenase